MDKGFEHLDTPAVVDLLAQKTQELTQLLMFKEFGKKYDECKRSIQLLQKELSLRKQRESKSGFSSFPSHKENPGNNINI